MIQKGLVSCWLKWRRLRMYTASKPNSTSVCPHWVVSRQNRRMSFTISGADVGADGRDPGQSRARAGPVAPGAAGGTFLPGPEPRPPAQDAAAALDHATRRRRTGLPMRVNMRRAEEEHVAEQHQPEEQRRRQRAFGPLLDARRKPVAGQQRKDGEARARQQLVQHHQHPGLEFVVGDLHRAQPEGRRLPPAPPPSPGR